MSQRQTNLGLLVLLAFSFASGGAAYAAGTRWGEVVVVLHGMTGIGIIVLTPWKSVIVRRGLRRGRPGASASIALGVLIAVTIAAGLLHAAGLRRLGGLTSMQVHVGAGFFAAPFAIWHVFKRPVRPHRADFERRRLLRAGAMAGGAAALWLAFETVLRVTSLRGAERRYTGSHEVGSFQPSEMPVTQWFDDSVPTIDEEEWRLTVRDDAGERVLTYADLATDADQERATLDCTGGWYAHQDWGGVSMSRLVRDPGGARSVVVRSVTGYQRRFPIGDLDRLLLAVRVAGAPLSRGHGFPARLVAPGRRGFWWVKWVDRIETSGTPWWWQSPFPLS